MDVMFDYLIKVLKQHFVKVNYEEQGGFYLILINQKYVLCLSKGSGDYLFGKLVGIDRTGSLECNDVVYYSPYGLYILAKSAEEFVHKLKEKIKFLK